MSPTRRFLLALLLLASLAVLLGLLSLLDAAPPFDPRPLWWGALVVVVLLGLFDGWALLREAPPDVSRVVPGNLPLGRWSDVTLTVRHPLRRSLRLRVFDHVPATMLFDALPQEATLEPDNHVMLGYRVRPQARGLFRFEHCELQLSGPLGLFQRRRLLPVVDETRVYPDFSRLRGSGLQGLDNWLDRLGVHTRQRRGLGLEFQQLREFRDGDTLRQIDWKATARARQPIARDYQDERDQQILFLIDCGRRMRSQDDELSHFDHALNACLLLAHVALRQGDAVGLATFANDAPRYVPPAKGANQLRSLLNALYDMDSTQQPADFTAAVEQVLRRQRRRALVVVVSNLRDEDDDLLVPALKRLGQRHRVLLTSLREAALDEPRIQAVGSFEEALLYCGTLDYLQARQELQDRLGAQGIPVLDSRPQALGPALVSRYLAMKKAGTL